MIRNASIIDSDVIAKSLWSIWSQFKLRQIPSAMHSYSSVEALKQEIVEKIDNWLICELPESKPQGFFSLTPIGDNKVYKRWRFPQRSVRIENFAWLQTGDVLLPQFQLLTSHLSKENILIVIPTSLREAYWAALKAGFRQLGESSSIVGGFVWLYFDRENRHEEIQAKLKKAKLLVRNS